MPHRTELSCQCEETINSEFIIYEAVVEAFRPTMETQIEIASRLTIDAILRRGANVGLIPDDDPNHICLSPNPPQWCKFAATRAVGKFALSRGLRSNGVLSEAEALRIERSPLGLHAHAAYLLQRVARNCKVSPEKLLDQLAFVEALARGERAIHPDSIEWLSGLAECAAASEVVSLDAGRTLAALADVAVVHALATNGALSNVQLLDTLLSMHVDSSPSADVSLGSVNSLLRLAGVKGGALEKAYLAIARGARVGRILPDDIDSPCLKPNPPGWCLAARQRPVAWGVLRELATRDGFSIERAIVVMEGINPLGAGIEPEGEPARRRPAS